MSGLRDDVAQNDTFVIPGHKSASLIKPGSSWDNLGFLSDGRSEAKTNVSWNNSGDALSWTLKPCRTVALERSERRQRSEVVERSLLQSCLRRAQNSVKITSNTPMRTTKDLDLAPSAA